MAIKESARQYALTDEVSFTLADLTSGVALEAFEVPPNAVVVGGFLVIDTVFNSGTSDTITVGDGVTANRYATAVNGAAAALTAFTLTGYKYTATDTVDITWTAVGTAATTGAGRMALQYYISGRSDENQG